MPGPWKRCLWTRFVLFYLAAFPFLWVSEAAAQGAAYFSPTYAASDGSPYSEVYARTFGTGGAPSEAQTPAGPPLVTAAPPAVPQSVAPAPGDDVVYVIEDGRLLTFSAEDYATGSNTAETVAPLPARGQSVIVPALELPSIADRLYGEAPLETAAGSTGKPIRLVPPQN